MLASDIRITEFIPRILQKPKMGVHVKDFSILLHGKHVDTQGFKIYRVGEKLTGAIMIAGEIHNISGLKLILAGRAQSYWKELSDDDKEISFQDEEKCIFVHVDLDIEESITSRKEYTFEFSLPEGLPSSFDGLYGDITYSLTAVLEMEERAISRSVRKEFKLEGYLNLKEHPEVLEPVEISVTKHILFGVGHLGLYAQLNKSGFLPGELAQFEMKFTNECDTHIQVNLFLLRETTYHSGENKITHTEIVDTVQGPAVPSHAEEEWNGGLVRIPSDCTAVLTNCKIMEMQYRFLIEMDIPGPHMNLEGAIPILVGTVSRDEPLVPAEGEEEVPAEVPAMDDKPEPELSETEQPEVIEPEPAPVPKPEESAPVPVPDKPVKKPGSSKFRARHQRAHTTTNVFRPKPVRQILPTPKPETWSKPIATPDLEPIYSELEPKEIQKPTPDMEKEEEQEQPVFPPRPSRKPKQVQENQQRQQQDTNPGQIPELGSDDDEQEQAHQTQSPTSQVTDDSHKYTGVIKSKKSIPYPTFVDSKLFPKPVKKCLVNVFRVAENKILEPIGWRIRKSKCCLERVGGCCCHDRQQKFGWTEQQQSQEQLYAQRRGAPPPAGFVLPQPTVGWGTE